MPLPPLPESNTIRYWVEYDVAGLNHTFQMRAAATSTDAGAVAAARTFINLLQPRIGNNVHFTGMSKAAAGSNIRNPVAFGGTLSGTGPFTITADERAFQISFVGRSVGGRKVRLFVFGCGHLAEGDFRYENGDVPEFDDALDWVESDPLYFVAIDGQAPVWKQYINYGYNDHWEKELRG